jgi:signal recognition particle GTPase
VAARVAYNFIQLSRWHVCVVAVPVCRAGEHMDQFEAFETKRFVGRLLGRGDVSGLMDKIQVRCWLRCD